MRFEGKLSFTTSRYRRSRTHRGGHSIRLPRAAHILVYSYSREARRRDATRRDTTLEHRFIAIASQRPRKTLTLLVFAFPFDFDHSTF